MNNRLLNGWNSFDGYNWSVTEAEMRANTDVIDKEFKEFGYQYIVLDFIWSMSGDDINANPHQNENMQPLLNMDIYGRLLPAPDRFPSSIPGNSLKPLADYIHGKGLKMGLHLMRGIPCQAVKMKTPILGTSYTAADIAITDANDQCKWLNHMYGIDMKKPGAQEYLDSIFQLYAEWGIDFVKVDDLSYPYHELELEGYRKAITNCGRDMALSLSPGPAPLEKVDHLSKYADMWRISPDFWDDWEHLQKLYGLFCEWSRHKPEKGLPDGDMIPFTKLCLRGPVGKERYSQFTYDEKIFLMSLWCLNNSPLMLGGDMTAIDSKSRDILTNPGVLAVQRFAYKAQKWDESLAENTDFWYASDKNNDRIMYCAVFNQNDTMSVADLPIPEASQWGTYMIQDLWNHSVQEVTGKYTVALRPHSAGLYAVIRK